MSKNVTGKIVRYSRENLATDLTDWAKVKAMTEEEIMEAALSGPNAQPLTPEQLPRMKRASDVPPEKRKRRAP